MRHYMHTTQLNPVPHFLCSTYQCATGGLRCKGRDTGRTCSDIHTYSCYVNAPPAVALAAFSLGYNIRYSVVRGPEYRVISLTDGSKATYTGQLPPTHSTTKHIPYSTTSLSCSIQPRSLQNNTLDSDFAFKLQYCV